MRTSNGPGVWLDRYIIDNWIRFDTMQPLLQELWKDKAARREFEDMQCEQSRTKRNQQPIRALPSMTPPEELPSQQLTLF